MRITIPNLHNFSQPQASNEQLDNETIPCSRLYVTKGSKAFLCVACVVPVMHHKLTWLLWMHFVVVCFSNVNPILHSSSCKLFSSVDQYIVLDCCEDFTSMGKYSYVK